MSRSATVLYAVIVYGIFFATFLYLIAFVGNLALAPVTVDRGPNAPVAVAIATNVVLISLFGFQHSIMARQWFKRAWTRIVPPHSERSTFVLFASLALIVLFAFWKPIPAVIWSIESPLASAILWAIFGLGWLTVLLSTFLINHFELFGLQQAYFHVRGRQATQPQLREPFLYRVVRHPLYVGFFLAFWATPTMTAGHLLLAIGMSAYMLIAIQYEERDLVDMFGPDYQDYQTRVGMLTPRLRRRRT